MEINKLEALIILLAFSMVDYQSDCFYFQGEDGLQVNEVQVLRQKLMEYIGDSEIRVRQ